VTGLLEKPLRYHQLDPGNVVALDRTYVVMNEVDGSKILVSASGPVLRLAPNGCLYRGSEVIDLDESAVSFPRPTLSPLVWDKMDDGVYELKPDVRGSIMKRLEAYPGFNLVDAAEEIHIVGSIGTNQYDDDSDIDVHVVPRLDALPDNMSPEDWVTDVKRFNRVGLTHIGDHPIELYLQLDKSQDFLSDAVYDFDDSVWRVGPLLQPLDFDPFEAYGEAYDSIKELARDTDVALGELKRDVIDYQVVRAAIFELPPEYHSKLRDRLQQKLDEVEASIDELLKDKKEWIEMRRNASKPLTKSQAIQDVELVRNWKDKNARFKFLVRFGYVKLITELERMIEDKELDDSEIGAIQHLVGV